jgi:hypothetical protein
LPAYNLAGPVIYDKESQKPGSSADTRAGLKPDYSVEVKVEALPLQPEDYDINIYARRAICIFSIMSSKLIELKLLLVRKHRHL